MRRGISLFLSVSALVWLTPSLFGQYPYPAPGGYPPPMPYGYPTPTPYGYPAPMPYGYAPMPMARPMYYPPAPMMVPQSAPMWQPPQGQKPKVYVFGPLNEMDAPPNTVPMQVPADAPQGPKPTLTPVQGTPTSFGSKPYTIMPPPLLPEACGPGCMEYPEMGCPPVETRIGHLPGHGHFIGEIGGYFLVPIAGGRQAFSTNNGGNITTTEFARNMDYGPSASVGYICHNGWGFRGSYWYLTGSASADATNPVGSGNVITSALAPPFQIVSPGAALAQGLGTDQFTFRQRLDIHVANVELLKECHFLDTTFLFGAGGRWTHVNQTYNATRTNPGGNNGAVTVLADREDSDSASDFQGWGPTVSAEVVHPLVCGFSVYGNARGSFLWGIERFTQNYRNASTTVPAGAAPVIVDVTNANLATSRPEVSILETEVGLQYGHRFGRCYVFARAGATFQRWWDVGSPTSASGSLSFLGGAARLGITY